MKRLLCAIVYGIAEIHNKILTWNDNSSHNFTDKELHFLVIGIMGMLMILAIYPVFKHLASKNHIMTITWIYVFTLIIVITFAIEIGQGYTGTGAMEFADIVFGIVGFLTMFAIFAILRILIKAVTGGVKSLFGKKHRR